MTAPARKGILPRFDDLLFRAERVVAGGLFVAMAAAMFVYVVHRVFSREEGRLSTLAIAIYGAAGGEVDAARAAWFHGPFSSALNLGLMFVVAYLAARTMKLARPLTGLRALAAGLVGAALLWGLIRLVLFVWPTGPEWAPTFALCSMLAIGFLGSSMATYERRHLGVEIAEKIWPRPVAPYVRALGLLAAAALCTFLLVLAWISLKDHYGQWSISAMAGSIHPTHIPRWAPLLVLPYAFTIMALRLLGQAVRSITHPEEGGGGGEVIPGLTAPSPGADDAEAR